MLLLIMDSCPGVSHIFVAEVLLQSNQEQHPKTGFYLGFRVWGDDLENDGGWGTSAVGRNL